MQLHYFSQSVSYTDKTFSYIEITIAEFEFVIRFNSDQMTPDNKIIKQQFFEYIDKPAHNYKPVQEDGFILPLTPFFLSKI